MNAPLAIHPTPRAAGARAVVPFRRPANAVTLYEDTERYRGGFGIRSETSRRIYKISFDNAPGAKWWTCSCPGNIRFGSCKHLRACGLKGRAAGPQLLEASRYGWE